MFFNWNCSSYNSALHIFNPIANFIGLGNMLMRNLTGGNIFSQSQNAGNYSAYNPFFAYQHTPEDYYRALNHKTLTRLQTYQNSLTPYAPSLFSYKPQTEKSQLVPYSLKDYDVPDFTLNTKTRKKKVKVKSKSKSGSPSIGQRIKTTIKSAERYIANLGKNIVNTAKRYLGFNEADNSYKKFTQGRTEAWCADFVTYVVKESYRKAGKTVPPGFGSPSVSGLMQWGKNNNRYIDITRSSNRASVIKQNVKSGDIIIFKSNGASHTGIVDYIANDGTIHTIEGNTSDRVAKRSYSPGKNTISGFIKMA